MDRDARRTNSGQWDDPVLSALSATSRDGSHTPEIGTGANVEKTIWLKIAEHDWQRCYRPSNGVHICRMIVFDIHFTYYQVGSVE